MAAGPRDWKRGYIRGRPGSSGKTAPPRFFFFPAAARRGYQQKLVVVSRLPYRAFAIKEKNGWDISGNMRPIIPVRWPSCTLPRRSGNNPRLQAFSIRSAVSLRTLSPFR
jgi:hypothetical protein